MKNYVQSKALLVVFTICPLHVLCDAKRKPSFSFCISGMAPSSSTAKSSESEESLSYSPSICDQSGTIRLPVTVSYRLVNLGKFVEYETKIIFRIALHF